MASKAHRKTKCLLHRSSDKSYGDLIDITANTWSQIILCGEVHKDRPRSSWLAVAMALPDCQPTEGKYHLACFRSFTAIPKTDLATKSEHKNDNKTHNATSPSPSSIITSSLTPPHLPHQKLLPRVHLSRLASRLGVHQMRSKSQVQVFTLASVSFVKLSTRNLHMHGY